MSTPISYDHRKLIVKLRNLGEPFSQISKSTSVPLSSVKRIWYRYQKEGEIGLFTKYANCGRKSLYDKSIKKRLVK